MPDMMYSFDWSGAGEHSRSLPNITCYGGLPGTMPTVEQPVGGWSRLQVRDWLYGKAATAITEQRRIFVGMDFPFSFPWVVTGGNFPGGIVDRPYFWANVYELAWGPENILTAQDYVNAYADLFAQNGLVGANYIPHRRLTEIPPALSVYNLRGISPGKGAITGIPILHRLVEDCKRNGLPLAIWPIFVLQTDGNIVPMAYNAPLANLPTHCLVMVETYPKLWWNATGQQLDSFDNPETWTAVRAHFNNFAGPVPLPASNDWADALITWYALAGNPPGDGAGFGINRLAVPIALPAGQNPATFAAAVAQEGWIFGA